jgi:hypothetical protein
MINLHFSISNPFKHKPWRDLYQGNWRVSKNKTLEIGFFNYAYNLFEIAVDLRFQGRDHAGLSFEIGILGWQASIALVDNRHWDTDKNGWEIHSNDP